MPLTIGELNFLVRRRAGQTVAERAALFHLPASTYRYRYELSDAPADPVTAARLLGGLHLEPVDRCRLFRRRARLPTAELARRLGVSRQRFHRLEARGDARVLALWRDLGHAAP